MRRPTFYEFCAFILNPELFPENLGMTESECEMYYRIFNLGRESVKWPSHFVKILEENQDWEFGE